jgi:glutathione S-transferase
VITLYQLHWSHYVEKVRWGLDFKGVEWRAIDVDPFSKGEMRHLASKMRVPTIHDDATGAVVGESSQILSYLDKTYPAPSLYPEEAAERRDVVRWMLWLDSTVGLAARRLAYTHIALECPGLLGELFVPETVGARSGWKARVAGTIIGGVLARRFRFLHNRADRVFEELEQSLLIAGRRISSRDFLIGDRFSAADLTLAALLRPVSLLPSLREHPQLQRLFEWRATQLKAHHRPLRLDYEVAVDDIRRRRGWSLGKPDWTPASGPSELDGGFEIPTLTVARNDQQAVGRWPLVTGPLCFLRLKLTSGLKRTRYGTVTN